MILCSCMGISEKEYATTEEAILLGASFESIHEDDLIRWNCAGTCCGTCSDKVFEVQKEVKESLYRSGLLK